ncbi:hypothetical protein [Pedobacter sp. GR22-6]|uniref:hypothetical protein n=1 Tax=Pedobacter sp. GR22-6 TaxID=3127957 RepID=UPI00307F2053
MSIPVLTESDLKAYQDKLMNPASPRSGILSDLKNLYLRFQQNEQNLADFKYGLEIVHLENEYRKEKQGFQSRLAELKTKYKLVDERIAHVELQLYQGIPEDLDLMDQLITEQESIIKDQEKLNLHEATITQQISQTDISYGKNREQLKQKHLNQLSPLASRFNVYINALSKAGTKIRKKARLYALIPILGIPTGIELLAGIAGVPLSGSSTAHHLAIFHPVFFISLVFVEIFLAERSRNTLYSFFALRFAKDASTELMNLLQINLQHIAELAQNSGLKQEEIFDYLSAKGVHPAN